MAYASASDVAAYMPSSLNEKTNNFTPTTSPTRALVEIALSSGCAIIETALAEKGYGVPVGATSLLYSRVVNLNTLYAVAEGESVRMSARVAVTERTRSQMFEKRFNDGLAALLKGDLSRAGVAHTSQTSIGGISKSDKKSAESDTDRVEPRFERGQFNIPGSVRPSGRDSDNERD